MKTSEKTVITIETTVNRPVEKVWELWNTPAHITKWNNASPDWHTPRAELDLKPGGKFASRMEAKDGSAGFDFSGTFNEVKKNEFLSYTMEDGRRVEIMFEKRDGSTHIVEKFEAETINSEELQRSGWQSILDNFKKYAESTK